MSIYTLVGINKNQSQITKCSQKQTVKTEKERKESSIFAKQLASVTGENINSKDIQDTIQSSKEGASLEELLGVYINKTGKAGSAKVKNKDGQQETVAIKELSIDELKAVAKGDVGALKERDAQVRKNVEETTGNLNIALVGIKGHSYSPSHPVAVLHFSHPNGLGAVVVADELPVAGELGSVAVMVEHIPFHTATKPCAKHTDVTGLDYVLTIEDLIVVGLVSSIENPSAVIREHADLDIVVLKVKRPMGTVDLNIRNVIVHGIRIDGAFCPLICEVTGK